MNKEVSTEKKIEMKLIEPTTMVHFNMAKYGLRKDAATIDWPGNRLHGMILCKETKTRKTQAGYGKENICFYLNEPNSPMFKTIEEFKNHYKTTL